MGLRLAWPRPGRATVMEMPDDRGVLRALYQGRTLDPLATQREQISDDELQKIAMRLETLRAFQPRIRDRRVFVWRIVLFLVAGVIVTGLLKRFTPAGSVMRDVVLVAFVVVMSTPWLGVRLRLPITAMPDEILRVFNEFRRCASCAYSLKELAPEQDGCTVCPECGAAWRLRPIEPAMKRKSG